MLFSPIQLQAVLRRLPPASAYRVAFSGGSDSTVLLHALAGVREQLSAPLTALHVDHGLHPHSGEWSRQCEAICAQLWIPCITLRVDARPAPGESREAAARHARYAALAQALAPGEAILTAHHRDDQAETFLLQLMRGAGPHGLAGMAESAPFAAGLLLRPLLTFSRAELGRYAREQGLAWIDDPSNFDVSFDRNFLRHRVMPLVTERWPAAAQGIARAARFQGEAAGLLDELAGQDGLVVHDGGPAVLRLPALLQLSAARRRNLLRFSLRGCGLPVPSSGVLERILSEVVPAREDATPCVAWPGAEVRRYRDRLYLLPPLPPVPLDARLAWDLSHPLPVPGAGTLRATPVHGEGLKAIRQIEVGFRRGGERCRPAGRQHTHALKKLLQEAGVPPWERERLPLVFVDGELAAVADLWVCDPYAAEPGEAGTVLRWDRGEVNPRKKGDKITAPNSWPPGEPRKKEP